MRRLKGALKTTSSSCTKLVHPGGINIVVVLHSEDSKPSIVGVFVLYADQVKAFYGPQHEVSMMSNSLSHYWLITPAFTWKHTETCLSYLNFSKKVIRFPVPLKITSGLTRRIPSAKIVS